MTEPFDAVEGRAARPSPLQRFVPHRCQALPGRLPRSARLVAGPEMEVTHD